MAEQVLAKLAVQIAANTAQFNTALKQSHSQLSGFLTGVKNITGTLGIAFGVSQVARFALETSKLAGEAKGVSDAFDRLENSERLMVRLKEATGDTVSELDLMKRAVQASNFDISLEALPKLLEFATLRAQQTGQSVDYLVDSIVTGIGRKSKLILDNLGISAVQLTEALGGASAASSSIEDVANAVGKIAEENLKKMNRFSENAATKIQRLSAEFTNFQVSLGTVSNNTDVLGDALDDLVLIVQNLTTLLRSDAAAALENYVRLLTIVPRTTLKAANAALEYVNELNSLETAVKDFNEEFSNTPFAGVFSETKKYNEMLADLEKKASLAGKKVSILSDELGNVVAVIKPFNETVNIKPDVDENAIVTIETLTEKLKGLTEEFRNTDIADRARLKTLAADIISTRKLIEELEKLLKVQAGKTGLDGLRAKLAQLNDEFERTDIYDKKRLNSISQEIRALQALINELEKLRKLRTETLGIQGKPSTKPLTDQVLNPKGLFDGVETNLKFDPLKNLFNDAEFQKAVKRIRDSLYGLQKTAKEIDISGPVSSGLISMAEALGNAAAGVDNFGESIIKAVTGFVKQLGALFIVTGLGKIAFDSFSGPAMVAAGIAMVAAASAAQSFMNNSSLRERSGGASQLSRIEYVRDSDRVYVEGKFEVEGSKLVAVLSNQNRRDMRVKAS